MAKQTINPGTAPTGAGGDTFRSGSAKLQANDDELYNFIGGAANTTTLPAALPITKGGTGATTAAAARTNLGLGTAAAATLTTSSMDQSPGRVMKVGDFGIGASSAVNTIDKDLFYAGNLFLGAGAVSGTPFAVTANVINLSNYAGFSAQIGFSLATRDTFVRHYYGGAWKEPYTLRSTANTTVDANGFIKAASPIAQLFADKIKLNDEAQQQNIEFEKLGAGDYLVKGSTGFAQEGWYVETPKDANGNVLVAVVYEQIANGDISVKTYDYMLNNKGRIVADTETPLDIPDGRWIDLRLQELPQPEVEVIDDFEQ